MGAVMTAVGSSYLPFLEQSLVELRQLATYPHAQIRIAVVSCWDGILLPAQFFAHAHTHTPVHTYARTSMSGCGYCLYVSPFGLIVRGVPIDVITLLHTLFPNKTLPKPAEIGEMHPNSSALLVQVLSAHACFPGAPLARHSQRHFRDNAFFGHSYAPQRTAAYLG